MLANLPILSFITFSPLLGVLVLLFMPKRHVRWIKSIAIAATLIPLLLAGWLYADFDYTADGMQYEETVQWINVPILNDAIPETTLVSYQFNYNMSVDGLSLAMVFLTALICTMAALASAHIKKRWKAFYILFLLLEMGIFGVFLSGDLFQFFMFFEITLVPMFFLIGIWGYTDREKAANKFLIYNGLGSAVMLIAFLILVNTAGLSVEAVGDQVRAVYSGNLQVIYDNLMNPESLVNTLSEAANGGTNQFYLSETFRWVLFLMLLVAFGIKLPIFPFHTWMLKVHTEAPPSVVMIHSGILLKMGAYGFIKFGVLLFPEQAKAGALLLAVLGVINIIYGAVLAFRQKEFKLVLAYSSISHMGIVMLGIAAFNQIGFSGAVFQMVSHGLISALMFLIVGSLYERTGTTMIHELGGLAKTAPFISGILLITGMASLGLPGLSGFVGELLAFLGLFEARPIVTMIGMLGIILAAVYVLRAVLRITFGPMPEQWSTMKDARFIEALPMIALVAFIFLLGLYPSVLSEPLQHTVDLMIKNMALKVGG
ncbi:MAG TPA: NADH-quinone oxidoreductase subunit M [Bacilli bacterium]